MQRALLGTARPLHAALASLLPIQQWSDARTFVCQASGECGFLQALTCPERREWQVIHLAPWLASGDLESGACWVDPLVDLCGLAGESGVWRIRAGVAAGGAEEEAFREAGFIPYTREEVYRLSPLRDAPPGAPALLRPVAPQDAWPLAQLVNQVVPPPVQHAEGLNISASDVPILARLGVTREQGYVWPEEWGLAAYAGLSRGAAGAWVRALLHPDARAQAAGLVRGLMAVAQPAPALYWAVREYQAGLRSTLLGTGFELAGVQVWLVRHTARPVECRPFRHMVALDKRKEPATTPLHPVAGAPPQ